MVTPAPRRGRRPGRPAQSDGPEQRQRLVDIAMEIFARQGYADTTLAAIARAAGMTPAAVHYYFRTREQLFDVLVDERIAPMRRRLEEVFVNHADDPVEVFGLLARRFVELSTEYPWLGPVFFGELLRDNDLFKQHVRKRFGTSREGPMLDTIRRWQTEGRLHRGLEPALLIPSLMSLTVLPMAAMRKWHDDPIRRHIDADAIVRHALAVIASGFAPPRA